MDVVVAMMDDEIAIYTNKRFLEAVTSLIDVMKSLVRVYGLPLHIEGYTKKEVDWDWYDSTEEWPMNLEDVRWQK